MPKKSKLKDGVSANCRFIIEEETDFIAEESEWLNNDLGYLVQSPLEVQLKTILGTKSAESFLHPTIKDKKKVKIDGRFTMSRKPGSIDAHELWNNLRAHSNGKLAKEQSKFFYESPCYGNKAIPEDKVLRTIQFSRHRTELMHRVSQMNRAKTKEFLSDFFMPSFDDGFSDIVETRTKTLKLPSNEDTGILQSRVTEPKSSNNSLNMKFMSEEDCQCPGKFRQRMEDIGIAFNTGISIVEKGCKNNSSVFSMKTNSSRDISRSNRESEVIDAKKTSKIPVLNLPDIHVTQRNDTWEPLTLSALVQDKKGVVLSG